MQSYRWKFPLIAVIVAGFLAAYLKYEMTLGIDLQGGSVLIYDLDVGKVKNPKPEITKSTIDILHRRLDTLGLKEMSIRQAGDYQIMIQLPGVAEQSKERIKDVIRRAGQLWFKIVVNPGDPGYDRDRIRDIEERKARGEYLAEEDDFDTAKASRTSPEPILVMNQDAVDGKLLEGADFTRDSWGGAAVRFYMKRPTGAAALAGTTQKHQGKQMAIILDGVTISAPRIRTPITEGTGIIEGQFTEQEVTDLITVLRSGALPAKPILASENTVEATLGQESISRGMYAMYGSVLVVMAFMFLYYRGAGAIANFALVLNIVLVLGFMTLFLATLTLPGIAGIVLTVGMAVDANILIYERIREEKRRGVPIVEAVNSGYDNAFWAIFDSNITTILTAAILYYVGTGPIKGFAVTLVAGIAISMFTALFVTRALFEYFTERGVITEVRMLQLTEKVPSFPFLSNRRPFMLLGLALLNIGYCAFVLRGDEKYGIDFNGGTAVQMRLVKPLTKADVEERLAKIERVEDGAPTKPYADAEVSRLGAPVDEKTGAGKQFQILISEHGRKKKAAARPAAGAVSGLPAASADVKPESGAGEGEAPSEAEPAGAQEVLIGDIERTFAAELAPHAFSGRRLITEAGGRSLLHFDVNLGEDDKTGVLKTIDLEAAKRALSEAGFTDSSVELKDGGRAVSVTAGPVEIESRSLERAESKIKEVFEDRFGTALSNPFPYKAQIGASVAETLKYRAVLAILLSLLMIVIYVAFRFQLKMGVAATLCLFHDVLVTLGFMMLLDVTSPWTGIDAKQNLTTIAAYLTIVGYSINDTIVSFDRMRENLDKEPEAKGDPALLEAVLNKSINQTLGRTILTSTTVFLTLLVLAVAGVKSIQGFTLAMLVGVIAGTYSTVFIATPILLVRAKKLATYIGAQLGFFIVVAIIGSLIH